MRLDNLGLIIHELGHSVGLGHTFGSGGGFVRDNPLPISSADCKLKGASIYGYPESARCESYGDRLCDTGLDPWTMNIDPLEDNYKDFHKWVDQETCTQIFPSFTDACFDCENNWDIPVHNYMSYYRTCRSEFTNDQFCLAHEKLDIYGEYIMMDCIEDPYQNYAFCTAEDIIIDAPGVTPWEDLTISLCPGQKIIIKPGSKLVIDNCLLTREENSGPNPYCPKFSPETLWDGIYVEGHPVLFGTSSNYGSLEISNSTIEYSKNGIQAKKGFWGIDISSSTFEHNLTQINVRYPYGFVANLAQRVYISESNFVVGDPDLSNTSISPVQIKVMLGNVVFNGCILTNPNEKLGLTGIQSLKGNLAIINGSKIENFHIGVYKTGSGFHAEVPRGLTITNSSIKDCDVSILNSSLFASVTSNWLEGDVISEGPCNGNWLSNNIKAKTFTLQSPLNANRIENNLFQNLEFDLYGGNENSSATCNSWKDVEVDAVIGHPEVQLISAWGTDVVSSGNRHFDSTDPLMAAEDKLKNYYYPFESNEAFSYQISNPKLTGVRSGVNTGCVFDYPIEVPIPIENFPEVELNFTTENSNWTSLNTLKQQKIALLVTATDSQAVILHEKIDQFEFEMDNIVGNVLAVLTKADSSIVSTWTARTNPLLLVLTNLLDLWYNQAFDDLSDAAELINDNDADALLAASEFLEGCWSSGRRLDSLTTLEVDTLSDIAAMSFGPFSNIVRDFLRMEYNVDIPWPIDNQLTFRSEKSISSNESDSQMNRFSVFVTKNQGCLSVHSLDNLDQRVFVSLFDFQGRKLALKQANNDADICFEGIATGMYIVTIFDPVTKISESHKIALY